MLLEASSLPVLRVRGSTQPGQSSRTFCWNRKMSQDPEQVTSGLTHVRAQQGSRACCQLSLSELGAEKALFSTRRGSFVQSASPAPMLTAPRPGVCSVLHCHTQHRDAVISLTLAQIPCWP